MSSPTSSNPPLAASFRVDKKVLLAALAEELKREKQRAEEAAQRMVEVEAQVEQKHREFLDEEMRLSAERDANVSTIAALRKQLSKLRAELEEASHVEEDEAQAYLALLSADQRNGGGPYDTVTSAQSHSALPHGRPPLSQHLAESLVDRGRSTSFDAGQPIQPSYPSQQDSARPPRPERPYSLVGHPFRISSPYLSSTVPAAQVVNPTSPTTPHERSFWQDSFGEPRQPEGVNPELAKGGGRWSRVFPGLKRKESASKAE
ncbi:hypothetical protein JCM8097_001420 [Rhodosporidiobolus ruineniae]